MTQPHKHVAHTTDAERNNRTNVQLGHRHAATPRPHRYRSIHARSDVHARYRARGDIQPRALTHDNARHPMGEGTTGKTWGPLCL